MTEVDLAFEAIRSRRNQELVDRIFSLDEIALLRECNAQGLQPPSMRIEDLRAQLFSVSRTLASRQASQL